MAGFSSLIERVRGWPWTQLLAVTIPLASAGFQLLASLRGDEAPVWLGPVESLGVTLLALLLALVVARLPAPDQAVTGAA